MTLMRVFSKVDKEGRIPIPANIRKEAGLKPGQLIEIKVGGSAHAQHIMINKRKQAR